MEEKATVMHEFKGEDGIKVVTKAFVIVLIVACVGGFASGYGFSVFSGSGASSRVVSPPEDGNSLMKGQVFGSDNEKVFKDSAEGVMREGGIEGEGQYHLERSGGESQNVYMTSSVIDLSVFINKRVKVWGETQKGQVAGWLMDVGRVEVL